MPSNTVRFATTVVAVCEGQHETDAANSINLGRSFKFEANYRPSATVLFKLSVTLTEDVTLYLRFTPDVIASLKKLACSNEGDNRPPYFDTIQRHLNSHRSFTRLEFRLHPYRRGQLIVPKGFDPNHYNNNGEACRVLASIASLAAASTFSLYMHDRDLPKTQYQTVYNAYQSWPSATKTQNEALERMMDLRTLYKGKGGARLDIKTQDGLSSLIPGAVAPTIPIGPPNYDCLPKYGDQDDLLPSSQQSTAPGSESDVATIAAPTPPGYEEGDHHRRGSETPGDIVGPCSKRVWSSGSENASRCRPSKRRATGPLLQHDIIEGLQAEIREQRERVERLEEENDELRSSNQDLEDRLSKIECLQEMMDEKVTLAEANHDELRQDHESLENQVLHEEERAKDWMEPMVQKYIQDKAEEIVASIKDDVRQQLRRAFDN